MTKQVLDVGNCDYDHHAIAKLLQSHFDAEVSRAYTGGEAFSAMEMQSFDLVLVNRILDQDGSEGLDLIQSIRRDPRWNHIPIMMVTNLSEHQQRAIEVGAVAGFGKASLRDPDTIEALQTYLA